LKILPCGNNSQSWRSAIPSHDFPRPIDGSGSFYGGCFGEAHEHSRRSALLSPMVRVFGYSDITPFRGSVLIAGNSTGMQIVTRSPARRIDRAASSRAVASP
jgi:hypothetical protein